MKNIKPEIFFIVILLIFGSILVFITPFGGGFDEDTHLGRIWEMSTGVLIPNRLLGKGPNYPQVFYQLSYRQDVNLTPISWEMWKSQMKVKIDWTNMINHSTRATYFPSFYLPQAFIMGIMGRVFDLPVGIIYYCLRLSYLLSFTFLVFLAIKLIPYGKWLLGLLAIMPTSIIQASIISVDAINNGIAFLFIAWVLFMNHDLKKSTFSRKDWIITLILSILVTTIKMNCLPLLFLLFLIPRDKFGSKKDFIAFILILLIAFSLFTIGWSILTYSGDHLVSPSGSKIFPQIIINDPLRVINAIATNIWTNFGRYYKEYIGMSGHYYWNMPGFIYWLAPILILVAILCENSGNILNRKKRIWMIFLGFSLSIFTVLLFYLRYNFAESIEIIGVQGRYFIAIFPLLFLAFVPKKPVWRSGIKWLRIGAIILSLVSSSALFLVFHFNCGSSFYSFETCYLPRYKNWDPAFSKDLPVSGPVNVSQSFLSECNNLNQIRIWIPAKPKDTTSEISLNLADVKTNEIMATEIYSQKDFPSSGWLDFKFDTIKASKSKSYVVTAESTNPLRKQDVSLAYYERNEYLAGDLTISGRLNEGDLLFQYGCDTGLAGIIHSTK